jgi:hypothetical protein
MSITLGQILDSGFLGYLDGLFDLGVDRQHGRRIGAQLGGDCRPAMQGRLLAERQRSQPNERYRRRC